MPIFDSSLPDGEARRVALDDERADPAAVPASGSVTANTV